MRFAYHWESARVRSAETVADEVRLIEIEPDAGTRPYPPGSHIQVGVLVDGEPQTRHYSLVGEHTPGVYRIAVRRDGDGRGGSAAMHRLTAGARIEVTRPASHFELDYGRPEYLLLAGGIGITPLVSMASTLRRRGADYRLVYSGRSRASMPFLDHLAAEHGDRLQPQVSEEGRRLDLHAALAALGPGAEVYLCGPMRLQDEARRIWRELDRPPTALRFETFASSGEYLPEPFTVEVVDTGVTVEVGAHVSMLDAMRAAGVEMMWDCLRGECGLCAVDVVKSDGVLDHRDVFLSESQKQAGRKICTCVSRAVGGVVAVDSGHRRDHSEG